MQLWCVQLWCVQLWCVQLWCVHLWCVQRLILELIFEIELPQYFILQFHNSFGGRPQVFVIEISDSGRHLLRMRVSQVGATLIRSKWGSVTYGKCDIWEV